MAPRWFSGGRPTAVATALALAAAATFGCESPAAAPEGALARYGLSGPPAWRVTLPAELREVSGLAVTADGRLFAHGDEEAVIYQLEPRTGKTVKRFGLEPGAGVPDLGKKSKDGRVAGDFEDIAIVGDRFFLVTSNAVLLEFSEGATGARVPFTAHTTGLGDTCEVEGLAHDTASGALLMLCKEMRQKAARDRVEIHAWSLAERRLHPEPRLTVPYSELSRATGVRAFNGSALAFTPGGRSLALIAGPQRAFAEITLEGRAVGGGRLDRAGLPQPEGIAFLPDGTLLISSEGGRGEATMNGYAAR
jgi:uncharacterized protein YjiK